MSEYLNQLKLNLNQPVLSKLETSDAALICTEAEVVFLNASGVQRASLVDIAKVNREGDELVISSVNGELIRGSLNTDKEALANFFTIVQSAGQRAHTKAAAARVSNIREKPAPPVNLEKPVLKEVVQTDSFHQDVTQAAPITKMTPVLPDDSTRASNENAGFWMRFLAAIIDGILVSIITSIISSIFGLNNAVVRLNEISRSVAAGGSIEAIQNEAVSLVAPILLSLIFSLLVNWLYFALLESSKSQATLGKMALGLKVTNMSEQPISFGQATWRYFAKQIPGLVAAILVTFSIIPIIPAISEPTSEAARAAAGTFLLLFFVGLLISVVPFVMAGFTAKKQALHDMLAKTLVVKPK
jgi:uncharacterized RDD family membrane protein YckC